MTDYLLLAGVALCLISVVLAVVQLMQTQPPRAAAVALVFGIALIGAGAWLSPDPFQPGDVLAAWDRVTQGSATAAP